MSKSLVADAERQREMRERREWYAALLEATRRVTDTYPESPSVLRLAAVVALSPPMDK